MMKKTKYLIIGGGMAADSAVRGIRSIDQEASISLISNESVPPYNRPPLSKGLWEGKSIEKIWRHTEKQHVDISLDTEIVNLNLSSKSVSDNLGNEILFEKVLLVTGTSPRKFPFGGDSINYLRYLKDFENLKLVVDQKDRFTVIGGGFIGSEIAASLSLLGKRVTIIFPERWMNQRIFPAEISSHIHDVFIQHDVNIMAGISVTGLEEQGEEKIVHLNTKEGISQNLISDGVIAGLGVIPNTKLAQDAGLAVENGIRVNSHFQTENAYVFSAGDVANYPDYYLKKNRRVEHEDHANMSGMLAGKNMTGAGQSYEYLPYFYSDLYDIGYEAVGELDSSFDVIIDWEEPFKKGTLYYQRELKIVGVLFWNNWGKLDKAREIILKGKNFSKNDLFGLIR
jgi:3-phenylpropionate/trans-cinnamate dioxygenase ferredoxin reductase subunit